ncbi:response regulator transcription factor [Paenibacillus faecalis]|uniref:response regulator transcription factor n=1 Tax=Paenibacillus faecalis TaxID=2079532 RepID=UPI000D0FD4CB|nr:response regulator [Paenibacillus faecalis]
MKILIVDDEPRHCRGMARMIQSTRSYVEVIIAKDGVQGLKVARSERPEVIFTDIRMPNMDGLTLLSELVEGDYKPKVVMLSAYNLFEYAQQALRHGAYDYLLKPVDIDKLEDVLTRIEIQLSEENAERSKAEWLHNRLLIASTAYRKQLIQEWLLGTLSAEGRRELDSAGLLKEEGTVIYSRFQSFEQAEISVGTEKLLQDIESTWSDFGEALSIILKATGSLDDHSYTLKVITVLYTREHELNQNRNDIRSKLEALSIKWDSYGNLTHTVGVIVSNLDIKAPDVYRSVTAASRYLFYECWSGVLFCDELDNISTEFRLELDEEMLSKSLQEYGETSSVLNLWRNSFEKLARKGHTDPDTMREYASGMLLKLSSSLQGRLGTESFQNLTESSLVSISGCESFSNLMTILDIYLTEAHRYWQRQKEDKRELVIDSCMELIHERFMDNLTLEAIAARYHFNVSYFSTMFKNYTGKNFSDYVIEVRMKKAKALLSESDMRIYEIAAHCGYRDTKYFARVFKKHTGVSPEKFRHLSRLDIQKDENI